MGGVSKDMDASLLPTINGHLGSSYEQTLNMDSMALSVDQKIDRIYALLEQLLTLNSTYLPAAAANGDVILDNNFVGVVEKKMVRRIN
jgi:hypothetical protein